MGMVFVVVKKVWECCSDLGDGELVCCVEATVWLLSRWWGLIPRGRIIFSGENHFVGYDMVSDQGLEISFEDCCLSLSILCFLFVESIDCSKTGMRPRYADLRGCRSCLCAWAWLDSIRLCHAGRQACETSVATSLFTLDVGRTGCTLDLVWRWCWYPSHLESVGVFSLLPSLQLLPPLPLWPKPKESKVWPRN